MLSQLFDPSVQSFAVPPSSRLAHRIQDVSDAINRMDLALPMLQALRLSKWYPHYIPLLSFATAFSYSTEMNAMVMEFQLSYFKS